MVRSGIPTPKIDAFVPIYHYRQQPGQVAFVNAFRIERRVVCLCRQALLQPPRILLLWMLGYIFRIPSNHPFLASTNACLMRRNADTSRHTKVSFATTSLLFDALN